MHTWKLQEAKAQFSKVVRLAKKEGPQNISVQGEEGVVLLSRREYEILSKKQISFIEFMASSPLKDIELDLERDSSPCREVEL